MYIPTFAHAILAAAMLAADSGITSKHDYPNKVYLIRHAEKPLDGSNGLSLTGRQRAECLTDVFSTSSSYNIGYILSEGRKPDGTGQRAYETVEPLAQTLGLPIDIHCKPKHAKCVRKAVEAFAKTSDKNILISWKHGPMTDIAGALGVEDPPIYPITKDDSEYEWIWIIDNHDMVSNTTSQGCPGLDVPYELGV